MIELTGEHLAELGYRGLTRDQMNELLRELYNAGEEIVGAKLASKMNNKQLDAFERLIVAGDESAALDWLQREFPKYREVVEATFLELDIVLRDSALAIRPVPSDTSSASDSTPSEQNIVDSE
jgi:replicative DNA helicase